MILFQYSQAGGISNGDINIFTSMINADPSFSVCNTHEEDDPNYLMYKHYKEALPDLTADDVRAFVQVVENKILSGEWCGLRCDNDDNSPAAQADVELAVRGNTKWLIEQLQAVADARLAMPA